MTAKEIWEALDIAGLVPPVHWAAAPSEWREVLLECAAHDDDRYRKLKRENESLKREIRHVEDECEDLADQVAALRKQLGGNQ